MMRSFLISCLLLTLAIVNLSFNQDKNIDCKIFYMMITSNVEASSNKINIDSLSYKTGYYNLLRLSKSEKEVMIFLGHLFNIDPRLFGYGIYDDLQKDSVEKIVEKYKKIEQNIDICNLKNYYFQYKKFGDSIYERNRYYIFTCNLRFDSIFNTNNEVSHRIIPNDSIEFYSEMFFENWIESDSISEYNVKRLNSLMNDSVFVKKKFYNDNVEYNYHRLKGVLN